MLHWKRNRLEYFRLKSFEYAQRRKKNKVARDKYNEYHRNYRSTHVLKVRARKQVYVATRNGTIKKKGCITCGKKAQAHHDDHKKPLEIKWLCSIHHAELHRNSRNK